MTGEYSGRGLADIIAFCKDHYINWGGRVLFFFFQILSMKLGMQGFMLVQAFVTGTALFFAYKTVLTVVNDHEKNWLYVLCVLLGSYLLFYPDTYKNALFWASASVLYVWPLCPLMIGIYLVYTWHFQHAQSCGRLFLMGMMFFLAGFSQEQIILAAISFAPLFLVSASSISQFRILKKPLLTVQCAALLGSCCMLAAPGNFKRLASGHDGGMHTLAELPAVTWELVRDMLRAPGAVIWLLSLAAALFLLRGTVIRRRLPFLGMAAATLAIFYVIRLRYISPRIYFPASFLLAIFCSGVFPVLVSKYSSMKKYATKFVLILLMLGVLHHSYYVIYGYYLNYPTVIANDMNLKKAGELPTPPHEVIFYKLPARYYHECMPYDNRPYIEAWIKSYYGLPATTIIRYEDSPIGVD